VREFQNMRKRRHELDILVGQNVRLYRMARLMSQADLGKLIGVTFQQVQKYEKGINRIGAGCLIQIAEALEVNVAALLRGTANEDRNALGGADNPQVLQAAAAMVRITDPEMRKLVVDLLEGIADSAPRAVPEADGEATQPTLP
jgi:transcriptional regulator with XRE-family HTH domain